MISEERLVQLEASLQEVGAAFGWASVAEQLELVRIARRVKPVRLPEIIQMEMGSYGYVPVVTVAELLEAIKAAGGTVEGES